MRQYWTSVEAKIESHYCWKYDDTKEYCESLTQEKPNDVHTKTAEKISLLIGKPFARSPAKSVKYAATYGAQPSKIAKTIGVDANTGRVVFDAFWEAAKPLATLKERLTAYWEKTGKKYILGIDGRKVPTRSAHSILNSLFQSGGVISAKRAMVIHDRLLRDAGLSVDFFSESLENREFAQQLIAYHDECQLEVSKKSVKYVSFATKEEAKEFLTKPEHKYYSEIIEAKGKFFVGWCLAGELAMRAVEQASEYYKLNVPLTAGYILGLNWADCH